MRAIPVITLAGAPDWMTSQRTATSNFQLELAPTPDHFDDFAELARRVALRYSRPSLARPVLHYQVWNELKGFWSRARNNNDYEAYTRLYNLVYDALKGVNPRIRVGGPYLVVEGTGSRVFGKEEPWYGVQDPVSARDLETIDYWMAHKHGADFLAVDRGVVNGCRDPNRYTDRQIIALQSWFARVAAVLHRRTRLPVWYSEAYAGGSADPAKQASARGGDAPAAAARRRPRRPPLAAGGSARRRGRRLSRAVLGHARRSTADVRTRTSSSTARSGAPSLAERRSCTSRPAAPTCSRSRRRGRSSWSTPPRAGVWWTWTAAGPGSRPTRCASSPAPSVAPDERSRLTPCRRPRRGRV